MPLFSIVIPVYNKHKHIAATLRSVFAQTFADFEVIVINDGSTDDSESEVLQFDDSRLVYVKTENRGVSQARNLGIEKATGDYIAFLDADDAWHPRKLEIQVTWMEAHPEITMTGTQTTVIGRLQEAPIRLPPLAARKLSFNHMLIINSMPTRSVVVRSNLPHRFLSGKRYSEDYLLWLSAIADGHQAFLLEVPLAYSFKRDFGAGGLSAHLWKFHCEVLDTYNRLYHAGYINRATHKFLEVYSLVKLLRRWLLSVNLNIT